MRVAAREADSGNNSPPPGQIVENLKVRDAIGHPDLHASPFVGRGFQQLPSACRAQPWPHHDIHDNGSLAFAGNLHFGPPAMKRNR